MFPEAWTGQEALPLSEPYAELNEYHAKKRRLSQQLGLSTVRPAAKVGRGPATIAGPNIQRTIVQRLHGERQPDLVRKALELDQERQRLLQQRGEAVARDNLEVRRRRDAAASWIAEAGRNGDLESFVMPCTGGVEPSSVWRSIWNRDDDWYLFNTCTVTRYVPSIGLRDHYLFISRASLALRMAELGQGAVPDVAQLPRPAQLADKECPEQSKPGSGSLSKGRVRVETKKGRGLREFLEHADANDWTNTLSGPQLRTQYERWCARPEHKTTAFGRSRFFELLGFWKVGRRS